MLQRKKRRIVINRVGRGLRGGVGGELVTILVMVYIMSVILRLKTKKEALRKRYMGITRATTLHDSYFLC